MELIIKVNMLVRKMKMGNVMVRGLLILQTVGCMSVNGKMEYQMVKGNQRGLMETVMRGHTRMVIRTVKEYFSYRLVKKNL